MKVDQSSKGMSRYVRNSSGNMSGKDSESQCELDLIRIGAKAWPGFGIVCRSQQAGVKVIGVRRVALVVSFIFENVFLIWSSRAPNASNREQVTVHGESNYSVFMASERVTSVSPPPTNLW